MANYLCKNCNYKFAPKSGKMPHRCPYCAESGTLLQERHVLEEMEQNNWEL